MAMGFFREGKHYTLQTIAKKLSENVKIGLEETKRLVGILKKYGVVKSVKKTKPEFEELSNADIVLTDVIDNSSDIEYVFDYVGVVLLEGCVFKCYPKYIMSTDDPTDELKQVLRVIKKYNSSQQLIYLFNGENDSKIFNKLAVSLHLLEEYFIHGLYTNQQEIIETNGEGEILWDKTINETFAIIQDNIPYYVELQTQNVANNDFDYFKKLHECVLSACSRELGKVGLLDLFEIPKVELTDVTIENFGDKDYILYRLQSEIQIQYITRKQNLLKTIYTYIANDKTNKQEINYSLYGTNSFNLVWEKVCSENFGSVLNEKISELPLNNALEYESIKNQTLRNIIEKPHWHRNNPKEEDNSAETLKPDMICVYPVDKNEQEYCFGIYDAKYYCIDFSKGKIMGQPGIADITKQYLYQLAYDDFISKQGYKYVQNMFLCPHEQAEKDYGFVEMKMLHQIGDKRLENIAIVNLCATEMYNIYLENRRIDMEHITQYIPSIGRQTVENQNFSNRMLSYLQGITISDKIAEEQFEMTVENRRLIYPQQIKREIGAKIIYDIICSIVCDTFYGFNPYEKEDYSNMIAESIGDSYGRCSQIADVAIEIEKNIKELSDQELQDEKVFKVILKKCFEGKNDITPILEENLEKFMGKVMELVEKIYL